MIVAEAGVNYVQDGLGMGLCFLNLLPADREAIAAYVEAIRARPVMRGEFHLRKSSRVSINLPVRVRRPARRAAPVDERTQIITLSKHGACLLTNQQMDVGMKVLLETPAAASSRAASSGGATARAAATARWASSAAASPSRWASSSPTAPLLVRGHFRVRNGGMITPLVLPLLLATTVLAQAPRPEGPRPSPSPQPRAHGSASPFPARS